MGRCDILKIAETKDLSYGPGLIVDNADLHATGGLWRRVHERRFLSQAPVKLP